MIYDLRALNIHFGVRDFDSLLPRRSVADLLAVDAGFSSLGWFWTRGACLTTRILDFEDPHEATLTEGQFQGQPIPPRIVIRDVQQDVGRRR